MLLKGLSISGFRCYREVRDISLERLTVIAGPNDTGKTCLLEAIDVLIGGRTVQPEEFHKCQQGVATFIEIEGVFELTTTDSLPEAMRFDGNRCRLIRRFDGGRPSLKMRGKVIADPRWRTFEKEKAPLQKELLEGLGIVAGANAEERNEQARRAISDGAVPTEDGWLDVDYASLRDHLPRFERIASSQYGDPETMVQRTLKAVVDPIVKPLDPNTGEPQLRPDLAAVATEIQGALNAKVGEMLETLRRIGPSIREVRATPTFDFGRGVGASTLLVDTGGGLQAFVFVGQGLKKKLWMGLLEWEEATRKTLPTASLLRAYDEPDVNLDYSSERRFFQLVREATDDAARSVQSIVCTHSVALIDRAPAKAVRLIQVDSATAQRQVLAVKGDGSPEVEAFLKSVGLSLGLTNTALLYERAFLVVEGRSEIDALPVLYRGLFGRHAAEDGVVLVNLRSCGSWPAVLGLLSANRAEQTVLMLDGDCQAPGSSGLVTAEKLTQAGFPAPFLNDRCFFVGKKEFEDTFDTADVVAALTKHWPRDDGAEWAAADVDALRTDLANFSNDLLALIRRHARQPLRSTSSTPGVALRIAECALESGRIPDVVRRVLERVHAIATV